MRRVVITGVGPISAIGVGRSDFWRALEEGRSGIGDVDTGDGNESRKAALIRNFNVSDYLETAKTYLDRTSQFTFAAMSLALEDANMDPGDQAVKEAGLSLGTAYGPLSTMHLFFSDYHKKGVRLVKPILFPHAYSNTPISLLAIEYGIGGYHLHQASGWTASSAAVAFAVEAIREGQVHRMFAGGFEAFHPILLQAFDRAGKVARDAGEGECARPYDCRRNGFVLGEGAGIVVLEEEAHARARNATILARVSGFGAAWGPRSREKALRQVAEVWQDGDWVIGHANGSREGDRQEAEALLIWGGGTCRGAVFAPASRMGETLGAAGVFQLIAAVGILLQGRRYPFSVEKPDPACPISIPCDGLDVRRVVTLSSDPGGASVALCLERSEHAVST